MSSLVGSTSNSPASFQLDSSTLQRAVGVVERGNLETVAGISKMLQSVGSTVQACKNGRENAHLHGELHSPLNGRQPIFALLGYQDIQTLEGRLLTIVDASFSDPVQRKAFKDLIRKEIWFNWVQYLDTDSEHIGMPDSNR